MALMNRTTGESSRDEAQRMQTLSSSRPDSPQPGEPQVLSWQTLNHLNKLELENSLLKQSLTELQGQMDRLTQEQNRALERMERGMTDLHQFVSDCAGQVSSLSSSNRQLQNSIDAAMRKAARELNQGATQAILDAEDKVSRVSVACVTRMEGETKQALHAFRRTEAAMQQFTERRFWQMAALYGSIAGNLICCIHWLLTIF